MDYTKNHHLPQWVKSDRIMMDDFNQMCRDIEAGLNKTQSSASSGVTTVQNNLNAAEERLSAQIVQAAQNVQNAALDGLRRAAYNHLYLADVQPGLRQAGLFFQGLGKDSNASVSGTLPCEDWAWTCNGAAALDYNTHVRSTVRVEKGMYSSDTCEFTYSLPYSAMLRSVRLHGNYDNNRPSYNEKKPYTLWIYNSDTGQTLLEKRGVFTLGSAGMNISNAFFIPVNRPFHNGNYRFRIKMDTLDFTPSVTFRPSESNCMDIQGLKTATASTTRTITSNEASAGGLAVVHYTTWGAGGSPSMVWDGLNLQPAATRQITNNQGFSVTEAEFRRYGSIPARSSLTLNMACAPGGEVCLYRWGGILF